MSDNQPSSSEKSAPIAQLTLRDYFAAAALQGQLAGMSDKEKRALQELSSQGIDLSNLAAESCYLYADAMLVARGKSREEIVRRESFDTPAETGFWKQFKTR